MGALVCCNCQPQNHQIDHIGTISTMIDDGIMNSEFLIEVVFSLKRLNPRTFLINLFIIILLKFLIKKFFHRCIRLGRLRLTGL